MTDEHKLLQANGEAIRAKALLEDEMLVSAFQNLEDSYTAAWRSTTIDDVSGREKLFLAINIVGKVRDHLQSVVGNGKLAQAELNELARTAERKKSWPEIR